MLTSLNHRPEIDNARRNGAAISTNGHAHGSRVQRARVRVVGCYIDVFELPHRKGRVRRLPGPASYIALRAGRVRIGSIEVGPNATVICFDSTRGGRSRMRLRAGAIVERLEISGEIDSFELLDQKQTEGARG